MTVRSLRLVVDVDGSGAGASRPASDARTLRASIGTVRAIVNHKIEQGHTC
jgi:hypothetical protein